jgi:amino-acid N-acetyltransferase
VSDATIHPRPSLLAAAALLRSADLPVADLADAHMADFFYCGSTQAPIGLVGLELHGTSALLRSLVVAPQNRSAGFGAALVERAEAYARERGVHTIYLLTTTAETFFRQRGYEAADRQNAPAEIKATREFADLCPASSAFLYKRL